VKGVSISIKVKAKQKEKEESYNNPGIPTSTLDSNRQRVRKKERIRRWGRSGRGDQHYKARLSLGLEGSSPLFDRTKGSDTSHTEQTRSTVVQAKGGKGDKFAFKGENAEERMGGGEQNPYLTRSQRKGFSFRQRGRRGRAEDTRGTTKVSFLRGEKQDRETTQQRASDISCVSKKQRIKKANLKRGVKIDLLRKILKMLKKGIVLKGDGGRGVQK